SPLLVFSVRKTVTSCQELADCLFVCCINYQNISRIGFQNLLLVFSIIVDAFEVKYAGAFCSRQNLVDDSFINGRFPIVKEQCAMTKNIGDVLNPQKFFDGIWAVLPADTTLRMIHFHGWGEFCVK